MIDQKRAPLSPHRPRGVNILLYNMCRLIAQPSTRRTHHDTLRRPSYSYTMTYTAARLRLQQ